MLVALENMGGYLEGLRDGMRGCVSVYVFPLYIPLPQRREKVEGNRRRSAVAKLMQLR